MTRPSLATLLRVTVGFASLWLLIGSVCVLIGALVQ